MHERGNKNPHNAHKNCLYKSSRSKPGCQKSIHAFPFAVGITILFRTAHLSRLTFE